MKWLRFAHTKAQQVREHADDHIRSSIALIMGLFSPDILEQFGLPAVVEMSQVPLDTQPQYQEHPFEVINRKKYIKPLYDIILSKVWEA
jgi:hypothetical protein